MLLPEPHAVIKPLKLLRVACLVIFVSEGSVCNVSHTENEKPLVVQSVSKTVPLKGVFPLTDDIDCRSVFLFNVSDIHAISNNTYTECV